jgi:uncharacterized protein YabE (DUF348 family)
MSSIAVIFVLVTYNFISNTIPPHSTAYADSAKVVSLYVDGEKRVMTTDASTVGDVLTRSNVNLGNDDLVEPAAGTSIPSGFFNINVYRARPVVVIDGAHSTTVRTAYQSPRLIAEAAGITVYPEDEFSTDIITNVVADGVVGQKVTIKRATVFRVLADGSVRTLRSQSATLGVALDQLQVARGEKDLVEPALDAMLTPGLSVVITRVAEAQLVKDELLPKSTKRVPDNTVMAGNEIIKTAGSDGHRRVTFKVNYRNGIEINRSVINIDGKIDPVSQIISVGTRVISGNEVIDAAARIAADRGWYGDEWTALYNVWRRESNFSPTAQNASSGACGIPQAYPCSKLPGFGPHTDYIAQINWGLDYIAARYGTPSHAWAFWQANGSY